MAYIDFAELKTRVTILDALIMLDLYPKAENGQLRCACPACDSGDDRAIVVTPEKGVFYCHETKQGGDCIALVAHVKGVGMKDAALMLDEQYPEEKEPESTKDDSRKESPKEGQWQGITYLQFEHEKVQEMGIDAETAEALGIGYCSKGMMVSRIAIPVRLQDGSLAGYVGIESTDAKVPRQWHI